MRIIHGGHTIDGRVHKQNVGAIEVWHPQTVVDGTVFAFDALNFPKKLFNNEQEAEDYAVEYGKWIVNHPTVSSHFDLGDEEKKKEDDKQKKELPIDDIEDREV